MDNIKKYLLENRSSLDTDIPDDANWAKLSHKLSGMNKARKSRARRLFSLGIAASLLLAAAGFALWKMNGTSNRQMPAQENSVGSSGTQASSATVPQTAASTVPQSSASKIPQAPADNLPQAEAVSNTYSPVVLRELASLGQTSFYGHDRSVFNVFSLQWKTLDSNEKAIQQNMRSVGPTDRLIQQLTDNYELKIRLLQQFSIEIKKVKHYLPPADTLVKIPSLSLLSIKTSNDEKQ